MGGIYASPAWLSSGVTLPGGAEELLGGVAEHCITENVLNITSGGADCQSADRSCRDGGGEEEGKGEGGNLEVRLEEQRLRGGTGAFERIGSAFLGLPEHTDATRCRSTRIRLVQRCVSP